MINRFVNIRKAKIDDISPIYKIALQHKINTFFNIKQNGFLIFVPSRNKYQEKIYQSSQSLVYILEKQTVGYLIAYTYQDIKNANKMNDPEIKNILSFKLNNFIYIEQITVDKNHQRIHVGNQLINSLIKNNQGIAIFTAIIEKPQINTASKKLFINKNKFKKISEIERNNFIAGIYSLG